MSDNAFPEETIHRLDRELSDRLPPMIDDHPGRTRDRCRSTLSTVIGGLHQSTWDVTVTLNASIRVAILLLAPTLWTQPGFAVDFNRDVRPILSDNCFQCHGPDRQTREAGLRLDLESSAKEDLGGYAAVIPSDPESSELMLRVLSEDPDIRMPPPDSGRTLSSQQIETLRRWIADGATWETHWAFAPVQRPATRGNPIDFLIRRRLEAVSLQPSPPAPPTTLLRRVTLDLTGLPPTIAAVEAFTSDIEQRGIDAAYTASVDRLLASPRFGEHVGWSWLEAARYADTDGYQNDGPRTMWRWRDWVIAAFNRNKPFDTFTVEQLAGDLLPDPSEDQLIATGFNRNHRYNSEAGIPIDEFLLENAVDRVDTTATVWMGLTMGCARCHDHKFDPFSQEEYYQLIDYFNDVAESGRAIKFGNSEPWIRTPTEDQRGERDRLGDRVRDLEDRMRRGESAIRLAQQAWEASGPNFSSPPLNDGLDKHFPLDQISERLRAVGEAARIERGVFDSAASVGAASHFELEPVTGWVGNGRFSISFWIRPQQVSHGAVLSNESNGTRREGVLVEFSEGRLRWHIIHRWISGVQTIETQSTLQPDRWTHVTLTNDGTQRTAGMAIYLDGAGVPVRDVYNTNSNTANRNRSTPLKIGFSKHAGHWQGRIDELRSYAGRTLRSDEVKLLAVSKPLTEILATAPGDRSEAESRLLRIAFLEQAAPPRWQRRLADLRAARARQVAYEDQLPTTMIMRDLRQGRPSHVRIRGVYDQLGDRVDAGVPEVFPPLPDGVDNSRLGFARWLVRPDHPLTARVTVNRFWQSLFGVGLVKTAEDFGSQGQPPSHPQLLDWLAAEFIDSGWDIKHLFREIVLSSTYRQSSAVKPEHAERDPENRWLARAPRLRLPGNVLRDQALAASGLLVRSVGGPSVKPYQPKGLWKEASNFTYSPGKGSDLYRRSLYTYWKRTLAPPTMALLDTGDREYCTVRPKRTNTPLQALALLNEVTFVEAARHLAQRTLAEGGDTDAARVRFAFRTLTARYPSEDETRILKDALKSYRDEFSQHPESATEVASMGPATSPLVDSPDVEVAAMTLLAGVILNLDEVTTRE